MSTSTPKSITEVLAVMAERFEREWNNPEAITSIRRDEWDAVVAEIMREEAEAPPAIKRHPRECGCTSCHYSKKFPQVKPHHATCGCFDCVGAA